MRDNVQYKICSRRRRRSVCASSESDQPVRMMKPLTLGLAIHRMHSTDQFAHAQSDQNLR